MKAITKLRRIAKDFDFKIQTKGYSFGRSISIVNPETNETVGGVFFEGCPTLARLLAFKAAIPTGLLDQIEDEEGRLTGLSNFLLPKKDLA